MNGFQNIVSLEFHNTEEQWWYINFVIYRFVHIVDLNENFFVSDSVNSLVKKKKMTKNSVWSKNGNFQQKYLYTGIKKMLTHLWEYLYDIVSNSLYMLTIVVNIFLESLSGD